MKATKIACQLLLSFICVAAALFLGPNLLTRLRIAAAADSIPEFTLTQVQTSVGANSPNEDKPMEERTIAAAATGLMARVTRNLVVGFTKREVFDPVSGLQREIYDDSKTYSTVKLSVNEVQAKLQRRINPDSGCSAVMDGHAPIATGTQTDLGNGTFLGISVRQFKYDFTNGVFLTTYLAPSLACESLFSQYVMPSNGVATVKTLTVTIGTPDPSLFSISNDYNERSYTASFLAHMKASGMPQVVTPGLEKMDEFYNTHRP